MFGFQENRGTHETTFFDNLSHVEGQYFLLLANGSRIELSKRRVRIPWEGEIKKLQTNRKNYIDFVCAQIERFLPCEDSIQYHFRIFDIRKIPTTASSRREFLTGTCRESLRFLFDFFKSASVLRFDSDRNEMKTVRTTLWTESEDAETLIREFSLIFPKLVALQSKVFRSGGDKKKLEEKLMKCEQAEEDILLKSSGKVYRQKGAWKEILYDVAFEYPTVSKLIRILMVIPTNSCGPERGFSRQNWLKDKRRTQMLDVTLNDIMHVQENKISHEEIDFEVLFESVKQELPDKVI